MRGSQEPDRHRDVDSLFKRTAHRLHRYACMRLGDPHTAWDAVHAVFLRVYRSAKPVSEISDGYLMQGVHRACVSIVTRDAKRAAREQRLQYDLMCEQKGWAEWSEVRASYRLRESRIADVIADAKHLPRRCRQVMELKLDGSSNVEIEKHLRIARKTVEYHVSLGIRRIREHLNERLI